jgi:hypothetical protein
VDFNIPGLDRGAAVASFAGAIAYLCTRDKLPAVRALGYLVAGTVCAMYVGPAVVEYLGTVGYAIGKKTEYGIIFCIGVGGIWIINAIVTAFEAAGRRVSKAIGTVADRLLGVKNKGGDK